MTKYKKYILIVLTSLMIVLCCTAFTLMSKTAGATTGNKSEENYAFCANSFGVEVMSEDPLNNCLYYTLRETGHGRGREEGGTQLLNVGCRNYKSNDFNYGTTKIPFWINMTNISNENHKSRIYNHIRVQAELWNQAYMFDDARKFVDFYEVISDRRPDDINGRKVIEVLPCYGTGNIGGEFDDDNYTIKLNYGFNSNNDLITNYQTAAHEFGHVLGLGDLDRVGEHEHRVLMGYGLSIVSENLNYLMHYQDIQGAAVMTGKHTCKNEDYMRYAVSSEDSLYYHICFYCDRINMNRSIFSGSKPIESNVGCSHDYKSMVSCGNLRWDKCTKCYNVKEIDIQSETDKNALFYSFGCDVKYNSINLEEGKTIPAIDRYAPEKQGYAFDGYCDASGKKYYGMQVVNDKDLASLNLLDFYYVEKLCTLGDDVIWDHRGKVTLYPVWKPLECYYVCENICDGKLLSTTTVHLTHGKNSISPITITDYNFKYFDYRGNQYTSIPAVIDIRLKRNTSKKDSIIPDDVLTAYYEKSCVAEGSLITLADGRQVAVENLTGDEMLLVWNLYTGTYDTAPILFIDSDPSQFYKVINLSFSDGTTVKVISEHGFWDYDLNKYVYLDKDADKYIGHWFNKGDERVQLVGVDIEEEYTSAWSPVTYGQLCYFVNGMLSMPGGIDGLFNIFEVDPTTMKYDETLMQADIENYGLFTYEEFTEYFYLPEEAFEAFNGQYLKVAIGKGLTSLEELASLYNRYSDFLA